MDPGSKNRLFRNDGGGDFVLVTDEPPVSDGGHSYSAGWVDVDRDGWLDLFVDNDQDLDLHVTNLYGIAGLLYRNHGQGNLILDESSVLSVDGGYGYESNWEDYNNDGHVDLIVANWGASAELYLNDGQGGFERKRAGELGRRIDRTGSLASGDFDADGDMDIYLANWPNEPGPGELNCLYRNGGAGGHWLQLRLVGRASNASAIGARVLLSCTSGAATTTQMRELSSPSGFRGQSAMLMHFGLGAATEVESIEVRWPSGKRSLREQMDADQQIEIVETEPEASS